MHGNRFFLRNMLIKTHDCFWTFFFLQMLEVLVSLPCLLPLSIWFKFSFWSIQWNIFFPQGVINYILKLPSILYDMSLVNLRKCVLSSPERNLALFYLSNAIWHLTFCLFHSFSCKYCNFMQFLSCLAF